MAYLPKVIKKMGGDDLLLWFLVENSWEVRAPKTSTETFTNILYNHLYSSAVPATWCPASVFALL